MEKYKLLENSALQLTAYSFQILLQMIITKFNNDHIHPSIHKTTQLYGFGNYNPEHPNLKQELEKLTGEFINGKYLYDKKRELHSGKPVIKLHGFYKAILFQYVGYADLLEFVTAVITDEGEQQKQLNLYDADGDEQNHFYVSYHFGEYKEIVKAQVIFMNNWKQVLYTYLYPEPDGRIKEFVYHGTIKKRADALHIRTKTLLDGKMVVGGENILYVGYGEPSHNKFMLGVFSAFDINNRVIAAKMIQEKYDTKEEMISASTEKVIPAYIAQELRNERIENDSIIPNSQLELSHRSPYSITYEKIPGEYRMNLYHDTEFLGDFSFSIDQDSFRLMPLTSGVLINYDHFELIQNGSVLHFSFQVTGIALFSRLEIFLKTYFLKQSEKEIKGTFSGLDIENRLISGEILLDFESA